MASRTFENKINILRGFLNREVINGERLDILYYMKYRPNFSIKNKIYTTLTTTYKKIGKLSFKYGIGDGNKNRLTFIDLSDKVNIDL